MADEVLKRDPNFVTVLGGITDDSNQYVTMLRVDPTTKRLLIAATFGDITFTSITTPLVIGGTTPTSTLTLRSTSGVGTTGADIIFQTGNNGTTEDMRILNSGEVLIGTTTPASNRLSVYNLTSTSGPLADFTNIQISPNNTDTNDMALLYRISLTATSATNQSFLRGTVMAVANRLTGGGAVQNMVGQNMSMGTIAGTTTDLMDVIRFDPSGFTAGTVTVGRGLAILELQGTTKYGIYDAVGTNWVNATGGTLNIGATTATTSCIATFTSTTGAVLLPRMTTGQRDALTPLAGMLIYNTSTAKLNVYTTAWEEVTSA